MPNGWVLPNLQYYIQPRHFQETSSWILLTEQTNFAFYTIKTRKQMAQIWPKHPNGSHGISNRLAEGLLVSFADCVSHYTNLAFYTIKIRILMTKRSPSPRQPCSQPLHILDTSWQLASKIVELYGLSRPILFTPSKSDLKWKR